MAATTWNVPAHVKNQPCHVPVANPATPLPRWIAQVIEVVHNGEMVQVTAQLFGPLALFRSPSPNAGGKLALTHLATGNRLAWMTLESNLRRMAELLMRELPALMRLDDAWAINKMRPRWVREWTRACEAADRWLDPAEFKAGKLSEEPEQPER